MANTCTVYNPITLFVSFTSDTMLFVVDVYQWCNDSYDFPYQINITKKDVKMFFLTFHNISDYIIEIANIEFIYCI